MSDGQNLERPGPLSIDHHIREPPQRETPRTSFEGRPTRGSFGNQSKRIFEFLEESFRRS
jgi:hypothetical protein